VFGLSFKVFLLLKKPKAKPNDHTFSQVLLEKLLFYSSILKAPGGAFVDFSVVQFEI
jgi:hypothetical protein